MRIEKLKGVLPVNVYNELSEVIAKYSINTELRLAHFLGQCHHESLGFKVSVENLNYSADRLLIVFPKYFNKTNVDNYHRNPVRIANRVYADRMGNGSEGSGEGYKYRGRGYIQLTGKNNYTSFGKSIGEDLIGNPDLVMFKYCLLSAGWFWSVNSINVIADRGIGEDVMKLICRKVNGGFNGLKERIELTKMYYKLLTN